MLVTRWPVSSKAAVVNCVRFVTRDLIPRNNINHFPMASEMQQVWKRADCVCFDVDSTVITEEGIDELAKFCNKGTEVANLTSKAMSGSMTFQESLKLRLDIIQPSLQQLKDFIKTKPPTLTPGIKKLVGTLQAKNIPIYLISGGFKSIIAPIAQQLNIPLANIYANKLKFFYTGEYAGFDDTQPTSKSGGKGVVINLLKDKHRYQNLVLIGDGATDLEACPPADGFIAIIFVRIWWKCDS
ncbi:phosphoserine phosphatase isoform X2 [Atheta coriaria]|uniref:phosphoserine phosphatase isoform X2 n=1 Tax=Dalotia coriaria TaxID=877792 RepID=UPI0031F46154